MFERYKTVAFVAGAALAIIVTTRTLSSVSGTSVLTYHNDSARTGQNLAETILRPDTVSVSSFGKVGFLTTDGKVDAQPLLLPDVPIPGQGTHNVVYVVTEHDSVYAFDSDSGAVLWRISTLEKSRAMAGTALRSYPRSALPQHLSSTRRVGRTA